VVADAGIGAIHLLRAAMQPGFEYGKPTSERSSVLLVA
jgi:hypothetical protein